MKRRTQLILIFSCILSGCSTSNAQTLKDAIKLTESEQYEMATDAFKKLVSSQPANGTVYFYFGENYLLADNKDSAKIIFDQGLIAEPGNVLNSIGLAEIELDNGNQDKGNKMIEDALLKAGSKNSVAFIEAANALIHFKSKNLDRAAQLLDKAGILDPKNPEVHIQYGDLFYERNNGSSAAEHYNKSLEADKASVKAIVKKGKLYYRSTNYEGAAEEFQNAINIDPNFAPAHRELGEAYIKLGRLEKAKEEYRKFLDLSRNNKRARIRYASLLHAGKDCAEALRVISQLQKDDGTNLTLLRIQAYCYYDTKDTVRALEAVQKLFSTLQEEKRTAIDYEYYGRILILSGRDSMGVLQLRKAYNIDKSRIELLQDLGNNYIRMKKYDDAATTFKEKINTGREVKSADYFKLGQSYFFGLKFIDADTALNKLVELQPKWPTGFLWNATNKTRIDSTSAAGLAKPMYEKYIELAIADSANQAKYVEGLKEAYSYLASYYYLQLKDNATTLIYLRKKLDITTDPEERKIILQQIEQIEKQLKK